MCHVGSKNRPLISSGYVKNMEDGTFAVNSDIFQKLDGYARIWYENSSAALEYNNTKGVIEVKEDGAKIKGFPEWKNNYNSIVR